MQLEEAITRLTEIEQRIQTALDEEQFAKLQELDDESQRLLRQMCSASLSDEEKERFRQFAAVYSEHIHDMLSSLQKTKAETKAAILKLNKSTKGSHSYASIATGRR